MERFFVLDSNVFLWLAGGRALFYSCRNFSHLLLDGMHEGTGEYAFCRTLLNPDNLYRVNAEVSPALVAKLERKRMGRVLKNGETGCSLPPMVSVYSDLDNVREGWTPMDVAQRLPLISYLEELVVYGGRSGPIVREALAQGIHVRFDGLPSELSERCPGSLEMPPLLSEEEILSQKLTRQRIFQRSKVNLNWWGRLYVLPDGGVYPLPVEDAGCRLGDLNSRLRDVILKELVENHAWRKVRSGSPCEDCVFRLLCPSPSIYEYAAAINTICLTNQKKEL